MQQKPFKFRGPAYDAYAVQATIQIALAAAGSPGRHSTQDADCDTVIEVAARLHGPAPPRGGR